MPPTSAPAGPTRQTDRPLERFSLNSHNGPARGLAQLVEDGEIDLAPPYQRGSVWTEDQRVALLKSMRLGVPIPPIIINDRHTASWREANGTNPIDVGEPTYAVIDGKQRLETVSAWFRGDLAVPASWFPDDEIESTHDTDDGPYVTWNSLSQVGRTRMGTTATLPRITSTVATIEEEAEIYLLVNGGGTAQSDEAMGNAARVAAGGR